MAKSGVKVEDIVTTTYEDIKTNKKKRWMLMKIQSDDPAKGIKSDKRVIVEEVWDKTADQESDYEELRQRLLSALKAKECRYAIVDLDFTLGDSGDRSKLVLISWAPDEAKVSERMVYSSTFAGLKAALGQGINMFKQANDEGDLDLKDLLKDLMKGGK